MNKKLFFNFCMENEDLPIFMNPWWLDATAGVGGWGVVVAESQGELVGALPFSIKKKYGFTALTQPPLTPRLGPWIVTKFHDFYKQREFEHKVLTDLCSRLPKFDRYSQNWQRNNDNWLPFYWRGFSQTTRYTYVLDDLDDLDGIRQRFRKSLVREIKKADSRYGLRVTESDDIDQLISLNKSVFQRQGLAMPYSEEVIRNIDAECRKRFASTLLLAKDAEGYAHAGIYVVHDSTCSYYLLGGSNPDTRTTGAMSLCLWESIRSASKRTQMYDFEGSMIKPIERYFRSFGGVKVPYSHVSKTPSTLLRIIGLARV